MGIRGLMTYINRNPNFLEDHELRASYIVIDALALAGHMLSNVSNNSLGGDHDVYANSIVDFFDQLHKCEVTPLVILDGGIEEKKLQTLSNRAKDRLEKVPHCTPASEAELPPMPLNTILVLKSVLKQKRVKIVQCSFEADSSIAAVAKILNYPVLGRDSDFYVFGVNYIPLDTLLPFVAKSSWGRGYVKPCKIFKPEYLLRSFPGLDFSVLPLAAVLLGNDYVKKVMFEKFHATLQLSCQSKQFYNIEQRRIDTTLRWLQNYNINDAVAAILGKLPEKRRRDALDAIEVTVDGYLNLPSEILLPLGFAKNHQAHMKKRGVWKSFKFQGNISTLDSRLSSRADETAVASEDSSSEEETKEEESVLTSSLLNYPGKCSDAFVSTWPPWFAHHYTIADFPSYFVDMMFHRLYTASVLIENFSYPSAHEISLKLVGVIDGLLVAGRKESSIGLLYVIREGKKFVQRRVNTVRGTHSTVFPALRDLRDTPMSTRKQIFYDTLEITGKEKLIEDIPTQWRLYIVTALYWMRQAVEPSRNWHHMHALLFTMLLGILDQKLDHCRSLFFFNERYGQTLAEIESKRKSVELVIPEKKDESIMDALKVVPVTDCLLASRFFISSCTMDRELRECPGKFNITIVHAFAQFQTCMMHAINLNSLLGLVYEPPVIQELYNGTMLYNLYASFQKSLDVDSYIAGILEKSPSLLRLLNLLTAKVKELLNTTPVDGELDEVAA